MTDKKKMTFNEKVAFLVSGLTGSMAFFWASLGFILFLRISHPPHISELLLDLENDLQLLLLAAAAVVANKQTAQMRELIEQIRKDEKDIKKEAKVIEAKLGV